MNRLDLSRAVVVPWDIPDMDAAAEATPISAFCEISLGTEIAAEHEPTAAPGNETPAALAAELQQAAPAHADGFAVGLEEGRQHGYAAGFQAGREAAAVQAAEQMQRLQSIVRGLGEPMRLVDRPVEEAVIAFALEVARWVIGAEVSRSRDYLVRLIREAVARVPIDIGVPAIVLNSDDAELIRALAPDLEKDGIVLISDETMEPGGCRIIAGPDGGLHLKDRRWHPRALQGMCEVDLTLASRWRDAMFAMFEGEDD
jgi:flagellar assembly protein FliH